MNLRRFSWVVLALVAFALPASAQTVTPAGMLAGPSDALLFGRSIDTDGVRVIVGGSASAWIYESTPAGWAAVATLTPFGAGDAADFARTVAIAGDYAFVAAPGADGDHGAIYVFHRTGPTTWTGTQRLLESPQSPAPGAVLGYRLRAAGTTLVASGPFYDRWAGNMGRVVFFERDAAGTYVQVTMLHALTNRIGEYTYFGVAMDFRPPTLVASDWTSNEVNTWTYAYDAASGATLTPVATSTFAAGLPASQLAVGPSEVLIGLTTDGTNGGASFWDRTTGARGFGDTPAVATRFGSAVDLDGLWAAAGPGAGAGFVHVYRRDASGWATGPVLTGSTDPNAAFGSSIRLRGASLLVGEPFALTSSTGLGRVHVYTLGCSVDADCGSGGHCTEGVCCDAACNGTCTSCRQALTGAPEGTCAATTSCGTAGEACTADQACGTGHCVDAICCDAICDATCTACRMSQTGQPDGTCAPLLSSADAGAGMHCSGPCDGGVCEAGLPDAGVPDAGHDAAVVDAGVDAARLDDASARDASFVDAGTRPRPELGCTCRAAGGQRGDHAYAWLLALFALGLARRSRQRDRLRDRDRRGAIEHARA
jgi:hypothetical protein